MPSRPPSPDALAAAFQRYRWVEHGPMPGRTNHVRAGVLVPLVLGSTLEVVLTERPATMRDHPGEVSFPGGKHEPTDPSFEATALREAREELGIVTPRVVGRLSSFPLHTSDFRLEPFVAFLENDRFVPEPQEVARVVRLEVEALLEREFLEGIPFRLLGDDYLSPVFEAGDRFVFGGTATVLHELLEVLAPALGLHMPPLRAGRYGWTDVLPPTSRSSENA